MTTNTLPWTPPAATDVEPLRVGESWDAVRVSPPVGERALALLGDDTGAVIQDAHGTFYWLVAIGSAASWHLRGTRVLCELVDEVTYLGVPPADWHDGPRIHWRVPLGPDRYLTNARLLWEALAAADHAELGPRVEGRQLCFRCQLPTDEPVIVGQEHGGSLGGGIIYACPTHAPDYQRHDPLVLLDALRCGPEAGA
ncbi:hypothetical protein [Streptomyces coffeae]|uniref:Uncharacterized protein n=1 Tax=Streptomyces coffeae TaxID=621382 RepID=A0ABS1NJC3_9ACTN|nr:hypothetical protein [Streptomyces coffeae]MBL1100160.1 hypothetical protein [Streptomyces coffeae]